MIKKWLFSAENVLFLVFSAENSAKNARFAFLE
jgi:hypothetical protein